MTGKGHRPRGQRSVTPYIIMCGPNIAPLLGEGGYSSGKPTDELR